MEKLRLEETKITPLIDFDHESGLLEIIGKSIPENPYEFYKPVYEWLSIFDESAPPKINVQVKMEYFNSSTLKCIIDILKKLVDAGTSHKGTELVIDWYYLEDDEDMHEAGEDCAEVIGHPVNFIVVK